LSGLIEYFPTKPNELETIYRNRELREDLTDLEKRLEKIIDQIRQARKKEFDSLG
jgi:hypothetical protein